jgi:hypothetical protein
MLRGPTRCESSQNKINLDTIIFLTFVTKFSFSFQIWRIYICKETTYIELKKLITKSGHKKSRDEVEMTCTGRIYNEKSLYEVFSSADVR